MLKFKGVKYKLTVALLAEGVDRNNSNHLAKLGLRRRPPRGGRG